jgi:hypothetical protein
VLRASLSGVFASYPRLGWHIAADRRARPHAAGRIRPHAQRKAGEAARPPRSLGNHVPFPAGRPAGQPAANPPADPARTQSRPEPSRPRPDRHHPAPPTRRDRSPGPAPPGPIGPGLALDPAARSQKDAPLPTPTLTSAEPSDPASPGAARPDPTAPGPTRPAAASARAAPAPGQARPGRAARARARPGRDSGPEHLHLLSIPAPSPPPSPSSPLPSPEGTEGRGKGGREGEGGPGEVEYPHLVLALPEGPRATSGAHRRNGGARRAPEARTRRNGGARRAPEARTAETAVHGGPRRRAPAETAVHSLGRTSRSSGRLTYAGSLINECRVGVGFRVLRDGAGAAGGAGRGGGSRGHRKACPCPAAASCGPPAPATWSRRPSGAAAGGFAPRVSPASPRLPGAGHRGAANSPTRPPSHVHRRTLPPSPAHPPGNPPAHPPAHSSSHLSRCGPRFGQAPPESGVGVRVSGGRGRGGRELGWRRGAEGGRGHGGGRPPRAPLLPWTRGRGAPPTKPPRFRGCRSPPGRAPAQPVRVGSGRVGSGRVGSPGGAAPGSVGGASRLSGSSRRLPRRGPRGLPTIVRGALYGTDQTALYEFFFGHTAGQSIL